MSLANAECPLDARKSLAVHFFVDAIRDDEKFQSLLRALEKLLDNLGLGRKRPSTESERDLLEGECQQNSSTNHHKGALRGNEDDLTQRSLVESCEHDLNADKQFRIEIDISVTALRMTTEDTWSVIEIQKAQLEDPDIRPDIRETKVGGSTISARNLFWERY
ncbi:hypothetical protein AVEN_263510-1 [Araneus ventricosus]|uniref:Uncharacterized protein n=1 Tax=Araneus ventricosus TaxID=182803 RepID=A0A4Y2EUT6_ARAVE|nr:hypothetical protein AVEN_263510-1 [Araneus ventricosus]